MASQEVKAFIHGVENLFGDEIISQDAASDEKNWFTQDGKIILSPGKIVVGAAGSAGKITGEIFGYKADGTKVHWRKAGTKIQYFDDGSSAWVDVITGLTSDADYSFSNYSSLAGTFTFAIGVDGIFKMHNANPGSYKAMYLSTKNFKGLGFIDRGRMILWNRPEDKTGLYGSYIDAQNSSVYTSVTDEVLATGDGVTTAFSGTLAQATGTRNVFGMSLNMNPSGITATDNFMGIISGAGVSGTINYLTGAYTLNFTIAPAAATQIRMSYQYEDSNNHGVTDFTKSATRTAGQGFQFPQDKGGDPIMNVLVGPDGAYYSMKKDRVYRLFLESDDLNADNNVFAESSGISSFRGAVSTGLGIVYVDTANAEKPELNILVKNALGDNLIKKVIMPKFKFENYLYDDCTMDYYGRYVLIFCKSANAAYNDTILMASISAKTMDIMEQPGRTFAQSGGVAYMGSSLSESVYNIFSGFDDDGQIVENFWKSKGETYKSENLKKYKRLRLRGDISRDQYFEVYLDLDDAGPYLVGTIRGDAEYVDAGSPQTIGSNFVGAAQIGGDPLTDVYPYFATIKLRKLSKFRKRKIILIAKGFGYASVQWQEDDDIEVYEKKMPKRFRQKQYVNLAGTTTDNSRP